MREIAVSDQAPSSKDTVRKAIKRLFAWKAARRGGEEWSADWTFSDRSASNPRDYLTIDERRQIREAGLEYGSVPSRKSLSEDEREEWRAYLAQRFEKPKSEVTKEDWDRANGWKIPSMTWVSLDAGLRPIEVERAKTTWVDPDNGVLRIPHHDSSKNVDNWTVALSQRTATALSNWLDERKVREKYEDANRLWLTRHCNPYQSASLREVLHRLCEIAGIETENRQMSWYAIRHSLGTYLTREEDLAAAQAQLRHTSKQTTMKYDQVPVEDRQDALEQL